MIRGITILGCAGGGKTSLAFLLARNIEALKSSFHNPTLVPFIGAGSSIHNGNLWDLASEALEECRRSLLIQTTSLRRKIFNESEIFYNHGIFLNDQDIFEEKLSKLPINNFSSIEESCFSLMEAMSWSKVLFAINKIVQVLTANLEKNRESSIDKRLPPKQFSVVALLALMVLLAVLRFAGKPFGSRSKGRVVLSLGSAADPEEVVHHTARVNGADGYIAYQTIRRFHSYGLDSSMLHLTANQLGI